MNLAHYGPNLLKKEEQKIVLQCLLMMFDVFLFHGKSVQFFFNRIQIYNKSTPYLSAGSFLLIPLDKIFFK